MNRLPTPPARRALRARDAAARSEDGFILLESIVALSLVSVILAALGTFAINSITQTNQLRARQAATQVATSAMTTVDSLPADDLLTGRDSSSANTALSSQWNRGQAIPDAAAILKVTQQASGASTLTAGSGSTAAVSTAAQTVTLNSVAYSVDTYVGKCVIVTGTSDCVVSGAAGVTYDRVVVWVTWKNRGCLSTLCTFATSTLINPDADPVFNTNKSTPPATPIVVNPGNQTSTVGGPVTLTLAVKAGTGVNPMTWAVTAGSLPIGLTLGTNGTISGTPTAVQSAASVTVTVTDAFTRTGSATFTWAVVAAPTITTPPAQTSQVGTATSLSISSTCPNSPCTFTAANLPAGLSINSSTGVISGTPTTAGTSSVTVTITDAANVSASTNPFTWTVAKSKPTISDPGTRSVTVGQNVSVPITFTCPTATCTIRLTNTVPGLGLTGTSGQTGNNTVTSGSVNVASGTTYIAGTVQASAISSGSSTAYSLQLTITDSTGQAVNSNPGVWTAYSPPTVSALGNKTVRVLETASVPLTYSCPVASCTLTLTGTITGLGLSTSPQTTANSTTTLTVTNTSGTIYYTGKVDSGAVTSGYTATYTPKITITDADAVTASTQGTWTVNKAPAITNPGTQAMNSGQNLSLQMLYTCPNGGCTNWSLAVQLNNDPNYYAINGNITNGGLISYNNTPAGTYNLRVTVTDSANQTDTIYFTLKVVSAMTVDVPDQTTNKPSSGSTVVTLDVSKLVNPTADGYTYSLNGQPTWLTIDSTTGVMTATVTNSSVTDAAITVTVTSTANGASKATDTFSWTIK